MKKVLIIVTLLLSMSLSGCAVNITPDSFIYQDEEVEILLNLQEIETKLATSSETAVVSNISLVTEHGLTLNGVKLINQDATANVILFAGNGMKISRSPGILKQFSLIPANVIWFDYQGTGVSEKNETLSIDGLKSDALNVFDFAQETFPEQLPIVIHGLSMGSLIAGYISSERPIDGLVLDGGITSVPQLVDNLVPAWSKALSTVTISPELTEINNVELVAQYTNPLLLLVGNEDTTTPVEFSHDLYKASTSKIKIMKILPETEHGQTMTKQLAVDVYKAFIAKLVCCSSTS
ncbi:hypothetical protein GCM10008107_20540 [Psychrosphaera saromensis]|uniref:Alpha/beta hydrolase n=1 Tax=Psychrosphaera saromensis TaxID=716813 RepID=A0A2S7UTZ4_9GAMM|nr:alpha/beta hydrolase [Psychrosphaera saromensis]PQJ52751.1 alpha/beta hydrolase [Psychrosphaera saromensis]GHB70953.1 hypothetical protein GCM10008107_20540 [Psychrosphaera saromensis]GLQ13240.1 hypothetical protein GCM10007917_06950 [Psychrosphaera saromensis]